MNTEEMIEHVRSQKCRACGVTEAAFVTYGGFVMGWFCNEHRPDKVGTTKATDIMECYEVANPEPGQPRELYPLEMNDKKHPFHALCVKRIELGIGRWDKIVTTLSPRSPARMNRKQRRLLRR